VQTLLVLEPGTTLSTEPSRLQMLSAVFLMYERTRRSGFPTEIVYVFLYLISCVTSDHPFQYNREAPRSAVFSILASPSFPHCSPLHILPARRTEPVQVTKYPNISSAATCHICSCTFNTVQCSHMPHLQLHIQHSPVQPHATSPAAHSTQSSAATCHIYRRRLCHNSALSSFRGVLWVTFTGTLAHTDISAVCTVLSVFTQQVLGSCYHCHEHLLTNESHSKSQGVRSPAGICVANCSVLTFHSTSGTACRSAVF